MDYKSLHNNINKYKRDESQQVATNASDPQIANAQKTQFNNNEKIANLSPKGFTETADRNYMTSEELADAQVGHTWFKDPASAHPSLESPTRALVEKEGETNAKLPSSLNEPVMTPEDLTQRIKRDCVPLIEAATRRTMPTFQITVDPTLSSRGIQAQAIRGREIRVAHPSYVGLSHLMLHECIHLLQQNKVTGGNKTCPTDAGKWENHTTDRECSGEKPIFRYAKGMTAYRFAQPLSREDAEEEADSSVSHIIRGESVDVHLTDVQVLNQDVTESENACIVNQTRLESSTCVPNTSETNTPEKPNLGEGRCVVFYVEMTDNTDDSQTFKRVAERFVKERPNRCYGRDESGSIVVNQPFKFQTGRDIIEGLQAIAAKEGKIAEVYIISHGYSEGIIGYDYNDRGLYTECNNTCPGENQNSSTICGNDDCRTVDDIKSVAPSVFTQNVKIVLHACNVSNDVNFAGALYKNIAKALNSKEVGVYGHDNYTKAGYNCSWVQHDARSEDGRSQDITVTDANGKSKKVINPEFSMHRYLQLGNHETCDGRSPIITLDSIGER